MPSTNHRIFNEFMTNENGWLVGDKAFVFTLTEDRGKFNILTPKKPGKHDDFKNKILNSSNANYTRSITSIRNVIESIMTVLKQKFEKISEKIDLKLIPYLEMELYNFAYLINEYDLSKKILRYHKKKK